MTDTIVKALVEFLYTKSDITSLLGSDDVFPAWIFEERLYISTKALEGSGKCAIVVQQDDGWTSPNEYSTAEFPLVDIYIFADPSRDFMKNIVFDDTAQKIQDIRQALDKYMHLTTGETVMWGSVRVIASNRLNHQKITDVPEGDGLRSGMVSYAVGVG